MKNKLYQRFAAGVALFYCSLIGVSQSIPSKPAIHFRLVHNTLIVLTFEVDRQGPFDFVLDTGADATVVDISLADKLSLAPLGQVVVISVAGRRTLVKSSLRTLMLGDAQEENHQVLIEDLSGLRRIDPRISGIVGQDFLSHFNYLLDYKTHSIRLEQGNAMQDALDGVPVPMELRQNKMLVDAASQSGHPGNLRLVLDSGATFIVLMRDASDRLGLPVLESRSQMTLGGNRPVHAGAVPLLTVGTEKFRQIRAILSTESAEVFADGLLPTSLFQSLYVNNRESYVIFNPRVRGDAFRR